MPHKSKASNTTLACLHNGWAFLMRERRKNILLNMNSHTWMPISTHVSCEHHVRPIYKIIKFMLWLESLYSLIWDILLSQINIWTTTTWSNVWVVLPKPSWWVLKWVLDMNTRFKVLASDNILQYMCDLIHVLIFVTFSKCRKSPKLTNIGIWDLHIMWERR